VEFARCELLVNLKPAHEPHLFGIQGRRTVNFALWFIGHGLAKRSPFMSTTLG
jgi:hypothetical protein